MPITAEITLPPFEAPQSASSSASSEIHLLVPLSLPVIISLADIKDFFPPNTTDDTLTQIFKTGKGGGAPATEVLVRGASYTQGEHLAALVAALKATKKAKEAEGLKVTIRVIVTDTLQRFNYEYFLKFLTKLFAPEKLKDENFLARLKEAALKMAKKTGLSFEAKMRDLIQPEKSETLPEGWELVLWSSLNQGIEAQLKSYQMTLEQRQEELPPAIQARLEQFRESAVGKLKAFYEVILAKYPPSENKGFPKIFDKDFFEKLVDEASRFYLLEEFDVTGKKFSKPLATTLNLYPWSQKADLPRGAKTQGNHRLYQDFEALATFFGEKECSFPAPAEVKYSGRSAAQSSSATASANASDGEGEVESNGKRAKQSVEEKLAELERKVRELQEAQRAQAGPSSLVVATDLPRSRGSSPARPSSGGGTATAGTQTSPTAVVSRAVFMPGGPFVPPVSAAPTVREGRPGAVAPRGVAQGSGSSSSGEKLAVSGTALNLQRRVSPPSLGSSTTARPRRPSHASQASGSDGSGSDSERQDQGSSSTPRQSGRH